MRDSHAAWLRAHPERTTEWLEAMVANGFVVHHIDKNPENNTPANLALIERGDHVRGHLFGTKRQRVKDKPEERQVTPADILMWRERMGYTQRDACQALGCSRGSLGFWERGEHRIPRYIGLAMMALALGMSLEGDIADRRAA